MMSSSLRLITSKFMITRSLPLPTLFSSSPLLTRNRNIINIYRMISTQRTCTTMPPRADVIFDESWVTNMCPKISSVSCGLEMTDNYYTTLTLYRGDEDSVGLEVPIVRYEDDTWLIQGKTDKNCFLSDIKLTLPTEEDKEEEFTTNVMAKITANIITTFRDIPAKRSWPYYDMFYDRTILGEGFCPVIAKLSQIDSFSIYKEENAKNLYIRIKIPGREKMKLTRKGLRVSLDMRLKDREDERLREPERGDVKTFFDYNTFFIEAKTKKEHYIKGIPLPKGFQKKHTTVKRKMKKGVLYAIIPCVKKEETNIN